MGWLERATANLTARSRAETFSDARREWRMTFAFNDRGKADGTCGLCDHEDIRYEHEIENLYTLHRLWVGSQCITKFIPVFVKGREITGEEEKARYLGNIERSARQKARQTQAFETLDRLASVDARFVDGSWKVNWRRGYSVKQMQMIVVLCRDNAIPYNVGAFRINTRREGVVQQLGGLELWQYRQLRPALTSARQREFDQVFGFRP